MWFEDPNKWLLVYLLRHVPWEFHFHEFPLFITSHNIWNSLKYLFYTQIWCTDQFENWSYFPPYPKIPDSDCTVMSKHAFSFLPWKFRIFFNKCWLQLYVIKMGRPDLDSVISQFKTKYSFIDFHVWSVLHNKNCNVAYWRHLGSNINAYCTHKCLLGLVIRSTKRCTPHTPSCSWTLSLSQSWLG